MTKFNFAIWVNKQQAIWYSYRMEWSVNKIAKVSVWLPNAVKEAVMKWDVTHISPWRVQEIKPVIVPFLSEKAVNRKFLQSTHYN